MELPDVTAPWEAPADLLDRKKYADFLTDYLSSQDKSFVLNLNAKWGTGKTFFLAHWCKSIEDKHPTVYVNAWESDFSEDPLLAVMSAIHEQLEVHLPEGQKTVKEFSEKFQSAGRFLRSLAPIVAKGLVHKALGPEAGEEAIEAFPLSEEAMAEFAGKSMGLLLEDHAAKVKSITEFKDSFASLINDVVKGKLEVPLFLFIDELDRCRPTYAIELLETVKHLFSTDNVVFVIATDSGQLQHSIRAIYGNDFDGGEYLRRFFDQEYVLPEPDYLAYSQFLSGTFPHVEALEYAKFEPWNLDGAHGGSPRDWEKKDSMATFLAIYAKHYDLSLRSMNQVVVRLEAILGNSDEIWDGPYLLLLLVLQAKYKRIIGWMKERCTKGNLMANHDHKQKLNERLISGGTTIRWFCYEDFGNDGHPSDEHFSVQQLAVEYIFAVEKVLQTRREKMHKLRTDWKTLGDYACSRIVEGRTDQRSKLSDMSKYFDHVEMAGALS